MATLHRAARSTPGWRSVIPALTALLLGAACGSTRPAAPVSAVRQQAEALQTQGLAAYDKDRCEAAAVKFERAERLFAMLDDNAGRAVALHHRGLALLQAGKADLAAEVFQQALGLNELLGRKPGQAENLRALSRCQAKRGERDQAIALSERALALSPSSAFQNDLAVLLMERGQDSDRGRVLDLLRAATGSRLYHEAAVARLNLGRAYLRFGQPAEAEQALTEAWESFRALGDVKALAETHAALAQLYEQRGETARAEEHRELARRKWEFLKQARGSRP